MALKNGAIHIKYGQFDNQTILRFTKPKGIMAIIMGMEAEIVCLGVI
jgi:hypothetical protein